MRADLPESDCLLNRSVTQAPCKSLAAQSVLLCQSGRQGANHFRLSGTKSSNTKKLSSFAPHKIVIAQCHWRVSRSEWRDAISTLDWSFAFVPRGLVNRRVLRMHRHARTVAAGKHAGDLFKSRPPRVRASFATVLCRRLSRMGVADATNGTGGRFH